MDILELQQAETEYQAKKDCPVCAKELVPHPFVYAKSCFVHGDYEILTVNGKYAVTWKPMPHSRLA